MIDPNGAQPGVVAVTYKGGLGNQLFQYSLGRIIATTLGFELRAHALDGFPGTQDVVGPRASWNARELLPVELYRGQAIELEKVLSIPTPRFIELRGFFQRYEYYRAHISRLIQEWLRPDLELPQLEPAELVLHIRSGESWRRRLRKAGHLKRRLRKSAPLPVSYYRSIVDSAGPPSLRIVTESLDDPVFARLVELYAPRVQCSSPLVDFSTLLSAPRLVMSTSTFAWWAAMLGNAKEVHLPLWAGWDPASDPSGPDVAVDSDRFLTHEFEPLTEDELVELDKVRFVDA